MLLRNKDLYTTVPGGKRDVLLLFTLSLYLVTASGFGSFSENLEFRGFGVFFS
jgi:hypothetical protein